MENLRFMVTMRDRMSGKLSMNLPGRAARWAAGTCAALNASSYPAEDNAEKTYSPQKDNHRKQQV